MEFKDEINLLYGLSLKLKSLNTDRNNIYLGIQGTNKYIIKIENLEQKQQIENAIKLFSTVQKSENILFSQYIKTKSNKLYEIIDNKIITIQRKENIKKIKTLSSKDIIKLGEVVSEFHNVLKLENIDNLIKSDFYKDYMFGDVLLHQSNKRLKEMDIFYKQYQPNYNLLTKGIIHNDLHIENIYKVKTEYFFIDFEHMKHGPLISDLGVLVLDLWNYKKGIDSYFQKLTLLLQGYEKNIRLNEYNKKNIVIFSLRYLLSDENWYNYLYNKGNKKALHLKNIVKQQQLILLKYLSQI